MGLTAQEYWQATPLNFIRMQAAYRRRIEWMLWPQRRQEAATWNVQIAKTENGKFIHPSDLYPLDMDELAAKPSRGKKSAKSGQLSKKEYEKLLARMNAPSDPNTTTP